MNPRVRRHVRELLAIAGFMALAAVVAAYILDHQRLRWPWEDVMELEASFDTAQSVTPGQGQTVTISGVQVGEVADVRLEDGRAVVTMHLEPGEVGPVYRDATILLRPKTGLNDMSLQLDPGTPDAPEAKEGWTIPIRATQPDINPDEILAMLDDDTRDYLKLLLQGAGKGLEDRAPELREVLRRFEPTHRDLARVNGAVAERRRNLRRLIHNLRVLNTALAVNDDDLAELIDTSATVMRAFASEERNISDAVGELPGTLSQTTETLTEVERFARLLGPTAEKLRPVARSLDEANAAVIPFAREIAPVLRKDIRPFTREARPLVRDLRPGARRLATATPALTETFLRINHLFNLAAFNPGGAEPPEKGPDRQEGYLFWVAWANHMATQLFSNADAHGVFRPVTIAAPCAIVEQMVAERPELEFLQSLTPILMQACKVKEP